MPRLDKDTTKIMAPPRNMDTMPEEVTSTDKEVGRHPTLEEGQQMTT